MPPPDSAEKGRRAYWLVYNATRKKIEVVYKSPNEGTAGVSIPGVAGRLGGMGEGIGATAATPPDGYEVAYPNGEVWDFPADGSEPGPINETAKQADRLRTAAQFKAEPTPTFKEDDAGNLWRWDPDADGGRGRFVPAAGMPTAPKPSSTDYWTPIYAKGTERQELTPSGDLRTTGVIIGAQDPSTGAQRYYTQAEFEAMNPELGALDIAQKRATLEHTRRLAANVGQGTPRQPRWPEEIEKDILTNRKLAAEMERYPEETAYARAQDVLKQRNAELDRQARETANAVSLFGQVSSAQQAAVPYAMLPGQEYFLGAEPGGLDEEISRRLGINPIRVRPQRVELNWDDIWRGSQARARGQ